MLGLVLRIAYRHDACAHPARPQESIVWYGIAQYSIVWYSMV